MAVDRHTMLRQLALHLNGVEPDRDPTDLHGLGALIGDARVVGLGEATHGSREIFLLKHRLIRVLVAELGFTVVALEAGWSESEAVDAYVADGHGDPAQALAGLGYWTWDTEEVLALIRWLRAWNGAHEPDGRVCFAGIDVRAADRAVEQLQAALAEVEPSVAVLARRLAHQVQHGLPVDHRTHVGCISPSTLAGPSGITWESPSPKRSRCGRFPSAG